MASSDERALVMFGITSTPGEKTKAMGQPFFTFLLGIWREVSSQPTATGGADFEALAKEETRGEQQEEGWVEGEGEDDPEQDQGPARGRDLRFGSGSQGRGAEVAARGEWVGGLRRWRRVVGWRWSVGLLGRRSEALVGDGRAMGWVGGRVAVGWRRRCPLGGVGRVHLGRVENFSSVFDLFGEPFWGDLGVSGDVAEVEFVVFGGEYGEPGEGDAVIVAGRDEPSLELGEGLFRAGFD